MYLHHSLHISPFTHFCKMISSARFTPSSCCRWKEALSTGNRKVSGKKVSKTVFARGEGSVEAGSHVILVGTLCRGGQALQPCPHLVLCFSLFLLFCSLAEESEAVAMYMFRGPRRASHCPEETGPELGMEGPEQHCWWAYEMWQPLGRSLMVSL